MKQTAVEWLVEQLRKLAFDQNHHLGLGDIRLTQGQIDELEEQAKEMERQQIIFFANFCRVFDVKNPNEIISVVELLDKYNQEGDYKK